VRANSRPVVSPLRTALWTRGRCLVCMLLIPASGLSAAEPVVPLRPAGSGLLEIAGLLFILLLGILLIMMIGGRLRVPYRWLRRRLRRLARSERDCRRGLMAAVPEPLLLCAGRELRIHEANEAALAVHGYSREELLGIRLEDLRTDSTAPARLSETSAVLTALGLSPPDAVLWHRRKQAQPIELALSWRPLTLGSRSYTLVQLRPLAPVMQLHHEMSLLGEHLHGLQHGGGIAVWELDLDSGRLRGSKGIEAHLNLPEGSFPQTYDDLLEWVAGPDRQALSVAIERAVSGRDLADTECELASGERFVRIEAPPRRPAVDGPRLRGRISDITAMKRMERSLRENEDRFRGMVEGLPDGLLLTDPQLTVRYANEAALQLWRQTQPAALIGRGLAELIDGQPVDQEEEEEPGQLFQRRRCLRPDGSQFIAAVAERSIQLLAGEGRLVMVRGHERGQRLAERLQQANQRLRHLSNRLVTLQERERRKLARDLHDEVGQALTAILLHVDLLARKTEDPIALARIGKVRGIVEASVQQVRGMLQELRPPQLDELGLGAAVSAQLERLDSNGMSIELDCPPLVPRPDPRIESVAFRLVQECVTNAVKHAKAQRLRVRLQVDRTSEALTVEVIDDGQGFEESELGTVQPGGSGLGLVGMRERVSLVGGELQVQSVRGLGSRISASLPLVPTEGAEHESS
jgi:PAS domain S-box-containing protein